MKINEMRPSIAKRLCFNKMKRSASPSRTKQLSPTTKGGAGEQCEATCFRNRTNEVWAQLNSDDLRSSQSGTYNFFDSLDINVGQHERI